MPDGDAPRGTRARLAGWARLRRSPRVHLAASALAGAAVVLLAVLITRWSTGAKVDDFDAVAKDWNGAIRRLGIEPAYPPEEDIHVGDLFAAVVKDNAGDLDTLILSARAIKLDHIDMDADLKQQYEKLPLFPATLPKPQHPDDIWEQQPAHAELFTGEATKRTLLPLALFPGFSISHARNAASAISWIAGRTQLAGNLGGSSSDTITLHVPVAETYGVPSLIASGHLVDYCRRTPRICTSSLIRDQLSSVVGGINDKMKDDRTKDRFDVELYVVNRIYMTRSIEQSDSISSMVNASAKDSAAPDAAKPADGAGGTDAAPTGSLAARASEDSTTGASQVLTRPVVFGFRAVHFDPTQPPVTWQRTDDVSGLDSPCEPDAWVCLAAFGGGSVKSRTGTARAVQSDQSETPAAAAAATPEPDKAAAPNAKPAAATASSASLRPTAASAGALFDGGGWTFDIFYCAPKDPKHPTDAESYALEHGYAKASLIRDAIAGQQNIGAVRLRSWPKGPEYDVFYNYEIRVTDRRRELATRLKALIDPIVQRDDASGAFRFVEVSTDFPDYISVVVCPGAAAAH